MKIIKLSRNKTCIIDDDDFNLISSNKWSCHHLGYAVRGKPQISMHRFIMGAKKGQFVDHINGNKLDNRRANLRFCTPAQNIQNTHIFRKRVNGLPKGVYFIKEKNAWVSKIRVNGQRIYLGYFKNIKQAKSAYNLGCAKYHGEFAQPNK